MSKFTELLNKVTDETLKASLLEAYTTDNDTAAKRATKTTKSQLDETIAKLKEYQDKELDAKIITASSVLDTLSEAQKKAVQALVPADSDNLGEAYTKKAEELGFSLTKSEDDKKKHLIDKTEVTTVEIKESKKEDEPSVLDMYRL